MKEQLYKVDLSKKYEEGLLQYVEGLDDVPSWPEYMEKGYTWDDHMKLNKLVAIECIKHSLNEHIEDEANTDEGIRQVKKLIQKAIEEYNNM